METKTPQSGVRYPRSPLRSSRESLVAEPRTGDQSFLGHGAFLLKKTEVSIQSEPAESFSDDHSSDRASTCSTTRGDDHRMRSLMGKFANRQSEESSSIWRSSEDVTQQFDAVPFGTTVSIQAAQPVKPREQQLHEMKGLQQAASMKRWAGNNQPAEAWGKLIKDPELWNFTGNVLVYFGYQRPQASFRLKASLLEGTKSEILIAKLQEGFQRTAKISPSYNPTSALQGMKNMSLGAVGRRQMPTLSENGTPLQENPIQHEIHFPAPEIASRQEILRHHITTRNFFALLLSKPLVGLTYYQALTDLHARLLLYMPPETDCAQLLIQHLVNNHLHNVANDPEAATGLLAWSENIEVRWQDGWREAFVHCVGMYSQVRDLSDLRDVGHVSRALLDRSYLELQARIEECEYRLSAFNFDDIWSTSVPQFSLPRRSFDRFRHFLRQYYEREYKGWPPGATYGSDSHWITRELVQRLQFDFGCLYEYYVDRNQLWSKATEKSPADIDLLTKLFLFFDKKHKYTHIPFPYPLLPATTAELFEGKQPKQGLFSTKARTMEKRVIHAFAEASNSLSLTAETTNNGLLEAFLRFEKSDLVSEANPREVRQGRWILLYGILQILSTLSVDTPGLWFKDAPYFLNPRYSGNPPWRNDAEKVLEEANPKLAYCWTVPRNWSS